MTLPIQAEKVLVLAKQRQATGVSQGDEMRQVGNDEAGAALQASSIGKLAPLGRVNLSDSFCAAQHEQIARSSVR